MLGIFAEARREGIRAAARERRQWPAQWVADVHSAYAVLAEHPLGTDDQVVIARMNQDIVHRGGGQSGEFVHPHPVAASG